jgi:hypothetical protein
MPVEEGAWFQGMTELMVSFPIAEEPEEAKAIRGQVYRRELQPYLTDHQWRYAVSEAIRTERWFPQVSVLMEWAQAAPPPPPPPSAGRLYGGFGCESCEGTGFEHFERSGYSFVRHCPRGCKPYNPKLDGPRGSQRVEEWRPGSDSGDGWVDVTAERQRRREPDPVTVSALERVRAICRQRYGAGDKAFSYPGIVEDIAAEKAELVGARQPGEEG